MQVRLFFRKPSPSFHSIEKLFYAIYKGLPDGLATLHYAPFHSRGFMNRIRIGLDARKNQSQINHITGDIHFIAMFLKKERTILTIHDIGSIKKGNLIKRMIIKYFWFSLPIKSVRFITVISEFTRQEVLEHFKIKKEKLFVINNCISDMYRYCPKKEKSPKPVILQIGTKANKNLENLLPALQNIECTLIIIGKLTDKQMNNLINFQIDFENYLNISNEELFSLYIRCDILAYVSIYEGFGMPVVEANAVGRPVIASNIEPIKSNSGSAALLVNPYSIEEIRKGIQYLITNPEFCDQLIERGLENAKKFRAEKIAGQYLDLYNKMLATKKVE